MLNIRDSITVVKRYGKTGDEVLDSILSNLYTMDVDKATEVPRRSLKRIIAHQQEMKNPYRTRITEADIARAKERPIQDFYDGKLTRVKNKLVGKCPFHEEKTASFSITLDGPHKNKYYCFGCQAHGDAVDYLIKLQGLDFISAVKKLIV